MPAKDPVEELYKLFLMGLMWLREEKPEVLVRRGSSVFSSYAHASPAFKSAQRLPEVSWDLTERLVEGSEVYRGDKHMGRSDLRRLIESSDKHNIILVVPRAKILEPSKVFGSGGYSHAITKAGIEFALGVMGDYSAIVDARKFLGGWQEHKAKMTLLNAKHPTTSRTPSPDTSTTESAESRRYIPPAAYGEEDFDW